MYTYVKMYATEVSQQEMMSFIVSLLLAGVTIYCAPVLKTTQQENIDGVKLYQDQNTFN